MGVKLVGFFICGLLAHLDKIASQIYVKKSCGLLSIPHDEIPANVTQVTLDRNGIKALDVDEFTAYGSLKRASFRSNNIYSVSPSAFSGSHLKFLDLGYNQLTYIPDFTVIGSRLRVLDLSYNDIKMTGNLRFLSKLTELYLQNNKITRLNLTSLMQLEHLHILHLSKNPLRMWPDFTSVGIHDAFPILYMNKTKRLPHLTHCTFCHFGMVYMTGNNLREYPNISTCPTDPNSTRLESLHLEHNKLGNNADTSLLQSLSIRSLYLGDNYYSDIPHFPNNVLGSLDKLSLRVNNISGFSAETLANVAASVHTIFLQNNYITQMPYELLATARKLGLQNNQISGLNALKMNTALCKNGILEHVYLSYNNMQSLYEFPDLKASLCKDRGTNAKTIHITVYGVRKTLFM